MTDGTPEEYIASLPPEPQAWLREFVAYVEDNYPTQRLTMFRSRPMFKFEGTYHKGYIMFTAAKTHFTTHALDFDLIEAMKPRFPRAQFGKGSIKVKFTDAAAKPVLREFVDEVMRRHGIRHA